MRQIGTGSVGKFPQSSCAPILLRGKGTPVHQVGLHSIGFLPVMSAVPWSCVLRPPNRNLRLGRSSTQQLCASILQQPTPEAPQENSQHPRLLSKLVSAHGASVTALHILTDTSEEKLVVSSSLDKSLCTWRLTNCKQTLPPGSVLTPDAPPLPPLLDAYGNPKLEVQVVRLKAPRAPVFSIVRQPSPAVGSVFSPTAEVLFCGNAAKEMFAWEVKPCLLDEPCPANFQMVATEYSGWVRSLAISGKWLISCGCNSLRQHDTSFPLPKEISNGNIEQAFKGDIMTLVAGNNRVIAGCADGCLRSWSLNNKTGALTLGKEASGAHSSRITGLALQGPHLYSTSLDGCIRVWRAQDLECIAEVKDAHDGMKIHAIALGPDNILYTGGDDKLIRRWKPLLSSHPELFSDSWPPAPPPRVSPSTSINAATGKVTSNLPIDSDDLDSRDCDLGGSLAPSREASPSGDGNGMAAATSLAQTPASGDTGAGSSGKEGRVNGATGSVSSDSGGGAAVGEAAVAANASSSGPTERSGIWGTNTSTSSWANGDGGQPAIGLLALDVAPGGALSAHESGLRCIAAGTNQVLVSGDANGDICIWATQARSTAS